MKLDDLKVKVSCYQRPVPSSAEDRFWEKVTPGPDDECWEWQGSRQQYGHGLLKVGKRLEKAHRVSYTLAHGDIPTGLIVRHKCDNPPCVNPSHLEIGTMADNSHDRDSRGRAHIFHGEDHPMARLTADQVRDIRSAPRVNGMAPRLAEQYGVSVGHIYNLRSKKDLWQGSL